MKWPRATIHHIPMSGDGCDVLVTGSGGFIGRPLVAELQRTGQSVAEIVDRRDCDMVDLAALRHRLAQTRPRAIVHLAANADSGRSGGTIDANSVLCALNLAKACRGTDCYIVHVGSYKQYGAAHMPFRETDPIRPTTEYGYSKQLAEAALRRADRLGDCAVTRLRLGPVLGPGQSRQSLVARVIDTLEEDASPPLPVGVKPWDPLYIDDAVSAIATVLSTPCARGGVFNVSGGKAISPAEVSVMVGEELGLRLSRIRRRAPISTELGWSCLGDTSLIQAATDWQPKTSHRAGIRLTVQAHRREVPVRS